MKSNNVIKLKHLPLILGSAVVASASNASENLIINGDFETGLSGAGYGSYNNEIGTFTAPVPPIVNNSQWKITPTYQAAEFKDLYPASPNTAGWAIKMGRYTNSYVTNTSTMNLKEGEYEFTANHWGELPDSVGSEFTVTLVGVDETAGLNHIIGTYIDETRGEVQVASTTFTLEEAGKYQLRLSGSGNLDQTSRAWVDDLTLVDIPEPASVGVILALAGISFVTILRQNRKK